MSTTYSNKVVATYMAILYNHRDGIGIHGITSKDGEYKTIEIAIAKQENTPYEYVPENLKGFTLDHIHTLNKDESFKPFWLEIKSLIGICDTQMMRFIITQGLSLEKVMVAELENRGALTRVQKQ